MTDDNEIKNCLTWILRQKREKKKKIALEVKISCMSNLPFKKVGLRGNELDQNYRLKNLPCQNYTWLT
jgi:hypothetical protein